MAQACCVLSEGTRSSDGGVVATGGGGAGRHLSRGERLADKHALEAPCMHARPELDVLGDLILGVDLAPVNAVLEARQVGIRELAHLERCPRPDHDVGACRRGGGGRGSMAARRVS